MSAPTTHPLDVWRPHPAACPAQGRPHPAVRPAKGPREARTLQQPCWYCAAGAPHRSVAARSLWGPGSIPRGWTCVELCRPAAGTAGIRGSRPHQQRMTRPKGGASFGAGAWARRAVRRCRGDLCDNPCVAASSRLNSLPFAGAAAFWEVPSRGFACWRTHYAADAACCGSKSFELLIRVCMATLHGRT